MVQSEKITLANRPMNIYTAQRIFDGGYFRQSDLKDDARHQRLTIMRKSPSRQVTR
jgi:hypothetical protein